MPVDDYEEEEYKPSTACTELKRKRDVDLEVRRKHLYRDFIKCKKYKNDPTKLVTLYSKYNVPFDQFANIQLQELTRWSVTECFENKFVRKTYENTFFRDTPPFPGSDIITKDQIKYMKNMYTITYNEDNVTKIEASPAMVKLAAKMHPMFFEVYGAVIENYPSLATFCYECIKFANKTASAVNNISSKSEYNSLTILLRLSMVYNEQTFDGFMSRLADEGSMIFTVDEGFLGSEQSIMEIVEMDFYLLKPMDRLYRLVNKKEGTFDYDNPMNVLCVRSKCHSEVLPAIYAEFCLLRFIAVITKRNLLRNDATGEDDISSLVTKKIRNVLENWTGIEEDGMVVPSSTTNSGEVEDKLTEIRGNLLAMFPGLLTIMLNMCAHLGRRDLVIGLTQNMNELHKLRYRNDKRNAMNLSKRISLNLINLCRLLTFNIITNPDRNQSCLTETVRKLLRIPTFLLFNAGGNLLDEEVRI